MSQSLTPELLKGLQGFIAFIDGGTDIEAIFDISAALAQHEVYVGAITYIKSYLEIAQLVEERYIARTPNLEALLKLPEDSLGFAYASHMKAANLDPEFYRKVELIDDMSYLALRMRQTHDIWHTVTGFDTDSGEIGLQAFALAQNRSPLAVMLIAAITLKMIKMNSDLNPLVRLIQQGYDLGYQAKPFLAQKW
jgi:ubiquinone biosynthesis protein COQ4